MRLEEGIEVLYLGLKKLDKRHLLFREQVKKDMILLHPGAWKEQTEEYQKEKVKLSVIVVVAGVLLAGMLLISDRTNSVIGKDAVVKRPRQGETTYTLEAEMESEVHQIEVTVGERVWTKEEVEQQYDGFLEKLEKTLLGDNNSKEQVREPLRFVTSLSGYPFSVAWECDDYGLVQSDGKLVYEAIPKDGVWTTIYARVTYDGMERTHPFTICLKRPILSQTEKRAKALEEQLAKNDESSRYEEEIALPTEVDGNSVKWQEPGSYVFLYALVAGIVIASCLFFLKDKDLHDEIAKREKALVDVYPGFLSKLTVYLVAGMPIRSAFKKIAEDMERDKNYLAMELKIAVREMESGIPELETYRRFGNRCQNSRYMKFATLLTQNVKAGNSGLKQLLKQEARLALEEQKNETRKKGEELSSKLLIPMMMQLFIVMVMIMVPVFLSF